MRFALTNAQSQHRAHHLEQQGMWMTSRVICWEVECASRKDGDHQHDVSQERTGRQRKGQKKQNSQNDQRRSRMRCKGTRRRPLGMDETEENLPGAPVKAESSVEGATAMRDPAEGPSEVE